MANDGVWRGKSKNKLNKSPWLFFFLSPRFAEYILEYNVRHAILFGHQTQLVPSLMVGWSHYPWSIWLLLQVIDSDSIIASVLYNFLPNPCIAVVEWNRNSDTCGYINGTRSMLNPCVRGAYTSATTHRAERHLDLGWQSRAEI